MWITIIHVAPIFTRATDAGADFYAILAILDLEPWSIQLGHPQHSHISHDIVLCLPHPGKTQYDHREQTLRSHCTKHILPVKSAECTP